MKLCPLGGVVSPAFIIQAANAPQGASGMGIAVFIVCSESHCYFSKKWDFFFQHWCHEGKLKRTATLESMSINTLVVGTIVVCQMQSDVARSGQTKEGAEQQSEVIYLCSQSCQHDETVCFSSNICRARAPGILWTNKQPAVLTAQRVILEPFREAAGAHSPVALNTHWFSVAQVTSTQQ